MKHWNNPAGALCLALWWLALLSGAVGCGITREVALPNGYICSVDKFIWIAHPEVMGSGVGDVQEIDVHGDLVFGTTLRNSMPGSTAYFIIETRLGETWTTRDAVEWRDELAVLGVERPNLRWPGPFFNGPPIGTLLISAGVVLVLILMGVWAIRGLIRHEHRVRRDRLDRL